MTKRILYRGKGENKERRREDLVHPRFYTPDDETNSLPGTSGKTGKKEERIWLIHVSTPLMMRRILFRAQAAKQGKKKRGFGSFTYLHP